MRFISDIGAQMLACHSTVPQVLPQYRQHVQSISSTCSTGLALNKHEHIVMKSSCRG